MILDFVPTLRGESGALVPAAHLHTRDKQQTGRQALQAAQAGQAAQALQAARPPRSRYNLSNALTPRTAPYSASNTHPTERPSIRLRVVAGTIANIPAAIIEHGTVLCAQH